MKSSSHIAHMVQDCEVRQGIWRRAWMRTFAEYLIRDFLYAPADCRTWCQDFLPIPHLPTRGRVFFTTAASEDFTTAASEDLSPDERETVCEVICARSAKWIEAALSAPEGAFVPEEGNEAFLARVAHRAFVESSSQYAFGDFEEVILIDDLCSEAARTRLEALAERTLALPELAWWSEPFDPAHYEYHSALRPENGVGHQVAQLAAPGEPIGEKTIRPRSLRERFSPRGRAKRHEFAETDRVFQDLPRIDGVAWWPWSEFAHRQSWISYRSTNPEWLRKTGTEIRATWPENLGTLDPAKKLRETAEQYHDALCTEQLFGADAGDFPLSRLVHAPIRPNDYRLVTIDTVAAWVAIVERYPRVILSGGAGGMSGWAGNAHGTWVALDWDAFSADHDGIYLPMTGALEALHVPARVILPGHDGGAWTMMTGWTPGSVTWLTNPL